MILKPLILLYTILTVSLSFSQEKAIYDIARKGNLTELKNAILKDENCINVPDERGYYPLTLACYYGNHDVAVYIAKHVANINVNSDYGTPLTAAVFKEHTSLTNELLELGADPNIADVNGTTSLHYAVMLKNEDIVRLLMNKNADTNAADNRNKTPLDYAITIGNKKIINLLKKEK